MAMFRPSTHAELAQLLPESLQGTNVDGARARADGEIADPVHPFRRLGLGGLRRGEKSQGEERGERGARDHRSLGAPALQSARAPT